MGAWLTGGWRPPSALWGYVAVQITAALVLFIRFIISSIPAKLVEQIPGTHLCHNHIFPLKDVHAFYMYVSLWYCFLFRRSNPSPINILRQQVAPAIDKLQQTTTETGTRSGRVPTSIPVRVPGFLNTEHPSTKNFSILCSSAIAFGNDNRLNLNVLVQTMHSLISLVYIVVVNRPYGTLERPAWRHARRGRHSEVQKAAEDSLFSRDVNVQWRLDFRFFVFRFNILSDCCNAPMFEL